ncbi:MAG TPA: glycosyl transferase family protein [Fluviicoccus sp.]|nr:glycosyl transferase family protein [Fluviicoccus sp.]
MVMKNIYRDAEHPFAKYVRILGKGKTGSRSLSFEEARDAFRMILDGETLDVQTGAFLMLLRVKEESPEELAGFVSATRDWIPAPDIAVDLDWSSYAGKRKHYPWFLLAALILAQNGYRVFMHGASGHTVNRLYTENVLPSLGFPVCQHWIQAQLQLQQYQFAYLPLRVLCPPLDELIQLRNVMGVRSPVHTLSRLINPLNARCTLQAIFHPAYRDSHQQAASLLGYSNSMVIKGEGGEFERNPDGRCLIKGIRDGALYEDEWPMLFETRHDPEEELDLEHFLAVWRGDRPHEYGEMAVIGTLAMALQGLQVTASQDDALRQARRLWDNREPGRKPIRGEEQMSLF